MKQLLLFALILFSFAGYSQHPIYTYMGNVSEEPNDGNSRNYATLTSSTPLDQTSAGANVTWDFGELEIVSFLSFYRNSIPTAAELEAFPNTSMVTTYTDLDNNEILGKVYTQQGDAAFAITGATSNGLILNYSTDECIIGHFPMSYGYSNTDTVGGTYIYGTYSGNFTGTITSTVDAYGTIVNVSNIDMEPENVTRLKTVQTVTLSYGFFTNAGTVTQTTYHYYRQFDNFPIFRSTTTTISVPLLSINQTEDLLEFSGDSIWLGNQNLNNQNMISLAPNPVTDQLFIQKPSSKKINELYIYDLSGKTVLYFKNPENNLNVSQLQKDVYFAKIKTDSGTFTEKIVKN